MEFSEVSKFNIRGKTYIIHESNLKNYPQIQGHECSLETSSDVLTKYLGTGSFVLLRRILKEFFILSKTVEKTKYIFRSSSRIEAEKERHLRYFYWTIHPCSIFRFYWEILMGFTYVLLIFMIPYYALIVQNPLIKDTPHTYFHLLNTICFLDIFINFFSGYVENISQSSVLNLRGIFWKYVFGYLVFDVIATVPVTHILVWKQLDIRNWRSTSNRFFRIARIFTACSYLDNLTGLLKIPTHLRITLNHIIFLLIFLEYASYIFFLNILWLFQQNTSHNIWDDYGLLYLKSVYCTIKTLFLVRPYHFGSQPERYYMLIFQVCLLICGNILNALLLAEILRFKNRTNMVLRKDEHDFKQIMHLAKFHSFTMEFTEILVKFIDFKFGERIYDEEFIFSTLTPHMRDEIISLFTKHLIDGVELFAEMPESAKQKIAVRLKQEVVLPNDVIMRAGQVGDIMYFIVAGDVAIFARNGKEICHLTDGAYFGEIAMITGESRTATIITIDFCELYELKRKDFMEVLETYPDIRDRIIQAAKDKYNCIMAFPDAAFEIF